MQLTNISILILKPLLQIAPHWGILRNQNFTNSCYEYESLLRESLIDDIGKIRR
jgi:hypothetical protein